MCFPRQLYHNLIQRRGGIFAGGLSQYIGRRLTIMWAFLNTRAFRTSPNFLLFLPVFLLSSLERSFRSGSFRIHLASSPPALSLFNSVSKGKSHKLSRSTLILTLCWFGRAFGVIPIFLSEISPPAFRSTFAGVAYQMGTMVSSASAQIEASEYPSFNNCIMLTHLPRFIAGGEHLRTTIQGPNGTENVPNYALIQGIFIGCVAAYIVVLTLIGPENHGSHFERGKTAFQAGASKEDVNSILDEGGKEKEDIQHVENNRPAKDNLA